MSNIRMMAETVAEKVLGRLLPQVEAKAGCSWLYFGCCENNTKKFTREYCNGVFTGRTKCEGVACPL
jgi:hypothetical protein